MYIFQEPFINRRPAADVEQPTGVSSADLSGKGFDVCFAEGFAVSGRRRTLDPIDPRPFRVWAVGVWGLGVWRCGSGFGDSGICVFGSSLRLERVGYRRSLGVQ